MKKDHIEIPKPSSRFKKSIVMNVVNYKLFIHMHQHLLHVIHVETQLPKQQDLKQINGKSQAVLSKS